VIEADVPQYLNDVFYIPHNLDFRGRAYPVPPHLNPVGDDLARGLLTFGIKKPLGERGLMWLRIHLANLYGFDKASFRDREQFAIEHEKDIFDSADDPLGVSLFDGRVDSANALSGLSMVALCRRSMAVSRLLL
jgi:DNA-directed RNA polymerase